MNNPISRYKELKEKIDKKLNLLNEKLINHQDRFNQNHTDWGFVGGPSISNNLDEITNIIK